MPTTTVIEFILQDEDTEAYEDVDQDAGVYQVFLSDPTNAFGVKRNDTGAAVVANNTPLVRTAQGRYEYSFADPAPGLEYTYYIEYTQDGETTVLPFTIDGGNGGELSSYIELADAETLADEVLELAAWEAATTDKKRRALKQATKDIDAAMRYQGRRYDLSGDQTLEFPRVPYEGSGVGVQGSDYWPLTVNRSGVEVWDWDEEDGVAVVPQDVKLATLYQADSLLDGKRNKRLKAQHDGVASQGVGSLSEAYSGKPVQKLCLEAYELVKKYQLVSGQLI